MAVVGLFGANGGLDPRFLTNQGQQGAGMQQQTQQAPPTPAPMQGNISTQQDPYAPWLRPDIGVHTGNILGLAQPIEQQGFRQMQETYGGGALSPQDANPAAYQGIGAPAFAPMNFPNQYNIPKFSHDMGLQQNIDAGSQFNPQGQQSPFADYQPLAPVPLGAMATGGSGMFGGGQAQAMGAGGFGSQIGALAGILGQQQGGGVLGQGGGMRQQAFSSGPTEEWNPRAQKFFEASLQHYNRANPNAYPMTAADMPKLRDFGTGVKTVNAYGPGEKGNRNPTKVNMGASQDLVMNHARHVQVPQMLAKTPEQIEQIMSSSMDKGQLVKREIFGVPGLAFGPRASGSIGAYFGMPGDRPRQESEAGASMKAFALLQDTLKSKLGDQRYNELLQQAPSKGKRE